MITVAPPMIAVPVDGGELAVGVWNDTVPGQPAVLAIHGITANHRCWPLVAERLPAVRIIAPDLRGRGASNTLSAPFGLEQHARDLVAALDHVGEQRVVVMAHSMGAFVAVLLAARFPERVAALVLVDGGLPLELPAGQEPQSLDHTAILGPAAQRLSMQFESSESYRDFWRQHPAFHDHWNVVVEGYVDYDLQGTAPHLRPSGVLAAVSADVVELYGGAAYEDALASIHAPTTFLRAARGLLDEPQALYPAGRALREPTITGMQVVDVDDVNHYTIVFGAVGADAIASSVRSALLDGVAIETERMEST